jgi:hypothetical protein
VSDQPYTLDSVMSLRPGWAPPFSDECARRAAHRAVWETVACPVCDAGAGLACEYDGFRKPAATHKERVRDFYDLTEYRGQ